MSSPAWMPFYIADYLADTGRLSAAEHGAYMLLIMEYWRTGGRIPNDDRQLARITRMTPEEWSQARPVIEAFFGPNWSHKRIDAEIANSESIMEKRSASARAAANARYAKRTTDAHLTHASRMPDAVQTHAQLQSQSQASAARSSTLPAEAPALAQRAAPADFSEAEKADIRQRCEQAARCQPSGFASILELLREGFDLDGAVLPVLRAKAEDGASPSSWKWYIPAIREGKRDTQSPPASAEVVTEPVEWVRDNDPRFAALHKARGGKPFGYAGQGGNGYHFRKSLVESVFGAEPEAA
jgi:uncharacterized protein YdaU (DUF1376 family)